MPRVLHTRQEGHDRLAEATPQALLDAAEVVFARDGFSGARVEDISWAAGHNKALIFYYFGGKDSLYRAMMARTKGRLFTQFEVALARYNDAGDEITVQRLRALAEELIGVIFDFYVQHPNTAHILAWEAAEGWQTFASCGPPATGALPARMLAVVREAQAAGIVRAELDPHILYTTIMSLPLIHVMSVPRFQLMFPDQDFASPAALAHAQRQITDMLLNGVLAPRHLKEHLDATRV
jgi:AcrR family transcriptional regulator